MKPEIDALEAGDAILSSEDADAALNAWTVDEFDATELGSRRWATAGDDQGG